MNLRAEFTCIRREKPPRAHTRSGIYVQKLSCDAGEQQYTDCGKYGADGDVFASGVDIWLRV